jgi:hypothetical protein
VEIISIKTEDDNGSINNIVFLMMLLISEIEFGRLIGSRTGVQTEQID